MWVHDSQVSRWSGSYKMWLKTWDHPSQGLGILAVSSEPLYILSHSVLLLYFDKKYKEGKIYLEQFAYICLYSLYYYVLNSTTLYYLDNWNTFKKFW